MVYYHYWKKNVFCDLDIVEALSHSYHDYDNYYEYLHGSQSQKLIFLEHHSYNGPHFWNGAAGIYEFFALLGFCTFPPARK